MTRRALRTKAGRQPPPPPPLPPLPRRAPLPPWPTHPVAPAVGRWLWTCRAGFEAQLFEELAWQKAKPALLGPALVESGPPRATPAFGRMGFEVTALADSPAEAVSGLPRGPAHVQVWVPDTDAGNALAAEAQGWRDAIAAAREGLGDVATPWAAYEAGLSLVQVCLHAPGRAAVGQVAAREAVSLAAGGRARMRRTGDAPSRAAMKLDEALDWYGLGPGRGEVCVDLGGAPGGWTRRLLARGARVVTVDPARLAPDVMKHPKVRHVQQSAFEYAPPEPVDWLFCDMAWRPLEVGQLLARWARQGWAAHLVANVKLPMKDKWPTLWRVRALLEASGWSRLRLRQLYHDRDEVTLCARRA